MNNFSLVVEAVAVVVATERNIKINPEMKTRIKIKWENESVDEIFIPQAR